MPMASENAHIKPLAGERPAKYAERVGKGYAGASIQKDKKNKGQFFYSTVHFGVYGQTGCLFGE